MGRMIRYELEKIAGRKIVWVGLVCLLLFCASSTAENLVYQYDVVTPDGKQLSGEEGKAYIKGRLQHYKGLLTEEKKNEILKTERAAQVFDYAYLSSIELYLSMMGNFATPYGTFYGKTVDEAFTERGIQVEIGNAYRWMQILCSLQMQAMFLGCVVIIGISGVFSEEYTRKTDALLLTARYGKQKCAQAKIGASFLFAELCCGMMVLTNFVPFFLEDGWEGWNAGVQLDLVNGLDRVAYTMNCKTAVLLFTGGIFLAMGMLTGMTLLISAKCKTPFVSIIVAVALYFLPLLLSGGLPAQVTCLTPIGIASAQPLLMPKFSLGGVELFFYAKILIAAVAVGAAAWLGGRRLFAGHQVA